jgi:hypothetical protein
MVGGTASLFNDTRDILSVYARLETRWTFSMPPILRDSTDHPETETAQRSFCPRCLIERNVPRDLDRDAWLNLLTGNPLETAEYPVLNEAHEQLAGILILAEASSRSAPVSTGLGTIVCADCHEPMSLADEGKDRSGPGANPGDETPRESLPFKAIHPLWDRELDG